MEPMRRTLDEAIKAVPAVKYALGMAGVAAAAAIVVDLFKDPKIAVLGSIIMLGLMVILFVFAQLVKNGVSDSRPLALVLGWTFVILTVATSAFIFTSFFFSWPRPLERYIGNGEKPGSSTPEPTRTKSAQTLPTATPSSTAQPKTPEPTRDKEVVAFGFTVTLLVPSDMSDAQVTVNGTPADIENRLPTAILVRVKPQKTNTIIQLSGKRGCSPIEQLISSDQKLAVNCR